MEWYKKLADDNEDLVTYIDSIGKSVEGRDQPAIHIAANTNSKFQIYFQCQIHASKLVLQPGILHYG